MQKNSKNYEISNDGKISTYPALYKTKEKWKFKLFIKRLMNREKVLD